MRKLGNGALELTIGGELDGKPVFGMSAAGRLDRAGWHANSDGMDIRIARDGKISGTGQTAQGQVTLEGTARSTQIELRIHTGLGGGGNVEMLYMLSPERTDASKADPDSDDCDVKYRTKLVPNVGGAGLHSVRVPYCD